MKKEKTYRLKRLWRSPISVGIVPVNKFSLNHLQRRRRKKKKLSEKEKKKFIQKKKKRKKEIHTTLEDPNSHQFELGLFPSTN